MPENTEKPKNARKRPWWETINNLKRMQREKLGLVQTVGDRRDRAYAFIVAYKLQNDGNSPSVREIMAGVELSTPFLVTKVLRKLEKDGRITRKAGGHCQITVIGGSWTIPGAENIIKAGIPEPK
jgi:SOS-response transcriptional repressor LexA